jgi:hypothetical protein
MKKKIIVIIIMCCLTSAVAYCFDDEQTHPLLTDRTISNSLLSSYLVNHLGFSEGIDKQLTTYWFPTSKSIKKWLQKGSTDEDSPVCRASTHFHDPLKAWDKSYVSDSPAYISAWCQSIPPAWTPYSNITWATGVTTYGQVIPMARDRQDMGWDNARNYFYSALTEIDPLKRDDNYVKTFRSVGQVLHLLQDMAVPAHVRNDFQSHLNFNGVKGNSVLAPLSWWGNPFEYYVKLQSGMIASAIPTVPAFTTPRLTDFWDTVKHGTEPGLAEYVNANFFSDETIPGNNPIAVHQYPLPQAPETICEDTLSGMTVKTKYKSRKACPTDGSKPDHFVALSLINSEADIADASKQKSYVLDKNVHNTYAGELIPRAVGYSAALLDYFFRGTLEISPPDQHVYAITDGSVIPQQFTRIKAKVMNTTPNEAILAGSLVAVARYKIDPNYTPDLSTALVHNTAASFSYSVSAPVAIQLDMNLAPIEYTFDFSGVNAIPAGITDLTLQVVFQGTLGNEENSSVAVGMKDLSEPTHHVIWNDTDMFSLNYTLYTAGEIRANKGNPTPTLLVQAGTAIIDPHDITFTIGYTDDPNSGYFSPEVVTATLPAGRHMRLIGIFDIENANHLEMQWTGHGLDGFNVAQIQPVKNQDYGTTWLSDPVATPFRNGRDTDGVTKHSFMQHYNTGVLRCKPLSYDSGGKPFCAYPVEQAIPAIKAPFTIQ